jgi:aspartate/methionine/tyrosine aminotransferase
VVGRETPALTFALSGLSKLAGLPQFKVGWISVSGPAHLRDEALQRLEIIADTYLSASTILQSAVPGLLPLSGPIQSQIRCRVLENRKTLLRARGAEAPWDVLPSEGGWYAILRIPEARSEELVCLELLNKGVIVHPGYFFDFPSGNHLVVSMIPPREAFARGVEALASTLR